MILVTGATGKNGTEILKRLSGRRERIRAMVHKQRDIVHATPNCALEFVEADFDDAASLRKALDGVQRAFLLTNSSERVEEQQLRFVALARESRVKHIVYLSQLHASPDSPLRFLRYHAAVEEALRGSGMSYTNLRPNLYMQALLMIGKSIASEGRFFAPAGDARVSVVDVASVAVAALTHTGHEGKTYDLTGPEALTHAEIPTQLSQALDRPVTFVDLPEQVFREGLRGLHMRDWQADGLMKITHTTAAVKLRVSPLRSKRLPANRLIGSSNSPATTKLRSSSRRGARTRLTQPSQQPSNTARSLKELDGCPTFASAYVGRERWAQPYDCSCDIE